MAETGRPLPVPDLDSTPYWEAAHQHRLVLPRCRGCGRFNFPPQPYLCPHCGAEDLAWTALSGRGTVYTFSVMHDSLVRGLPPPYVVASVELEEQPGLRVVANIPGCSVGEVFIGMPVEVTFEDVDAEISLPQFRRRAS